MRKMLMRTTLVVMLVALGMLLEHVRAQGNGPLADAQFNHLGFVVRDVDESIKAWNAALQADHTPVHEVANLPWPASSPYDRKTVVRTTEILCQVQSFISCSRLAVRTTGGSISRSTERDVWSTSRSEPRT